MERRSLLWNAAAATAALLPGAACAPAQPPRPGRFDRQRNAGPRPLANSDSEKRTLAVLDRMPTAGETFLDVGADSGRLLRLLAESMGAKNVVEIGTSTGYSGLWLSLALTRTGGKLTTFEIDPGRAAQARAHFREAGVESVASIVQGDAHQNVKAVKGPIDLLFIDADKEGYPDYLAKLLPLVRPGGVVVADNIDSAREYAAEVARNSALDTIHMNGMSVSLKKR